MTPDWLKDPPQITPEVQAIRDGYLIERRFWPSFWRDFNAQLVPFFAFTKLVTTQRTGEEPV